MDYTSIAAAFCSAREQCRSMGAFPGGKVPADLPSAFEAQEAVIAAWGRPVVGWKVAAIAAEWRDRYAAERLPGPIFEGTVWQPGATLPFIHGGFNAIEVEFVLRIGEDVPARAFDSPDSLKPYVSDVHAGFEWAGSPLPDVMALGPGATAASFGNNHGLVLGPALPDFFARPAEAWHTALELNGQAHATGDAARIPGGPLAALQFLVGSLAARGRQLKAGDLVSTGASTGVHSVIPATHCLARFGTDVVIEARVGD